MEIKIDEEKCRMEIEILRTIQSNIEKIMSCDMDAVFIESSGETVETMKTLVIELILLKDNIFSRMDMIVNEIENYVNDYVTLEKNTVTTLSKQNKGM
ncbi:MAG: hypothetical protein ACK5LC_15835 [Coprobacillaceae bacterium]